MQIKRKITKKWEKLLIFSVKCSTIANKFIFKGQTMYFNIFLLKNFYLSNKLIKSTISIKFHKSFCPQNLVIKIKRENNSYLWLPFSLFLLYLKMKLGLINKKQIAF